MYAATVDAARALMLLVEKKRVLPKARTTQYRDCRTVVDGYVPCKIGVAAKGRQ